MESRTIHGKTRLNQFSCRCRCKIAQRADATAPQGPQARRRCGYGFFSITLLTIIQGFIEANVKMRNEGFSALAGSRDMAEDGLNESNSITGSSSAEDVFYEVTYKNGKKTLQADDYAKTSKEAVSLRLSWSVRSLATLAGSRATLAGSRKEPQDDTPYS